MTAVVRLPVLHPGQVTAFKKSLRGPHNPNGRLALRCGRRWGKTDLLKTIAGDRATRGYPVGWFAPSYKIMSEAYNELSTLLEPVKAQASKIEGVIRTTTGGRIDFWTLEDERAGRSRMYKLAIGDEVAFTKPNMADIWEKSIEPTLLDLSGSAIMASNTNGIAPDNFMWAICNEKRHGFVEHHAPSWDNPHVPRRLPGESEESHAKRRIEAIEKLRETRDPLVFAQEYGAEFVDWSGVAFFSKEKLLVDGKPLPWPAYLESVFAVVDTSVKTGKTHDGTAVTYWGYLPNTPYPLQLLDWDIVQFEGAVLDVWLKTVFTRLDQLTREIRMRVGSLGVFIEDQNVGTILLQRAANENWPVQPCPGHLMAMGKDGRAINASPHVYQDLVKFTQPAYDKTVTFKETTVNHQLNQVTGFRVGDPLAHKRADDLLDTFTYGVAIGLGDAEGFA
jgi:hypothetical protein